MIMFRTMLNQSLVQSSKMNALNHQRNLCSQVSGKRLQGKVAVVTASTDGIGFAIAERLGQEGAKVVVSSRKEKNVAGAVVQLAKAGVDVIGVKCHVGNAEDRKALFEKAVERYGGIDILVSNAAVNPEVGAVLDASEQAWDKIFEVNVKCSFLLAKEVLPYIRKRGGGGSIVFVSSIAGFQPFSLLGAYSVSKTALFGLTKAASQDLACENIRVNCIAPGIVKTKFAAALHESESARDQALEKIPMGRFAQSHEIAGVCAFLVSDDASYITGETIVASGGMPSRL
ncbi:dehydrogenase/reductase SDR family member 4 [Uranotaenia lowii]|uniref:dehydrogenase/reductase SDR family member 4 n=1 Tax=Uranotaenia lowii TaxID=190385 RepID=UPI00247AE74F|nr:dehydrogenase/reductase SDR family member 4 [Uranotaenia lowii]